MGLIDEVIQGIQDKRDNILAGNINSIPSPFERFRNDFIGIEQAQYITITSQTKVGKTQLASYLYIYSPLLYAYSHRDQVTVNILYFPLEETPERVTQRFMCHLLFVLSGGRIEVSPSELRSTANEPLNQEVIDTLKSEEYLDILRFFEEHVHFISESPNPTGIYKVCVDYAKKHGTVYTKKVRYGDGQEHDVFDRYEPNDPQEYNIIFLDHIGLLEVERGMTLKQSIDKMSEYFAKYLRNRYGFTCVSIQQQSAESDGLEAQKMGKPQVSITTLGDSKYSARDANIVIGLFSPFKYEIPMYHGYDIRKFKDSIRFMQILINRDGQMGGVCPLYFNGKTCTYKELPLPGTPELQQCYTWIENKQR